MQHRFVVKLLTAAHERWGSHGARHQWLFRCKAADDEGLESIDLVLLELKAITRSCTSGSPAWTIGPVHGIRAPPGGARRPVWIRFVLVPGWTDDMDEVGRIADFAASLGNVERVDVLPFIRWAVSSGRSSGWITNSGCTDTDARRWRRIARFRARD